MPKLPERIRVERSGGLLRILVDGEEFPFCTDGGVKTDIGRDRAPSITITIPAMSVEIVDALTEPQDDNT